MSDKEKPEQWDCPAADQAGVDTWRHTDTRRPEPHAVSLAIRALLSPKQPISRCRVPDKHGNEIFTASGALISSACRVQQAAPVCHTRKQRKWRWKWQRQRQRQQLAPRCRRQSDEKCLHWHTCHARYHGDGRFNNEPVIAATPNASRVLASSAGHHARPIQVSSLRGVQPRWQ